MTHKSLNQLQPKKWSSFLSTNTRQRVFMLLVPSWKKEKLYPQIFVEFAHQIPRIKYLLKFKITFQLQRNNLQKNVMIYGWYYLVIISEFCFWISCLQRRWCTQSVKLTNAISLILSLIWGNKLGTPTYFPKTTRVQIRGHQCSARGHQVVLSDSIRSPLDMF